MCVDNDFRVLSNLKAEKVHLKHKKKHLCSSDNYCLLNFAAGLQWLTHIPTLPMTTRKMSLVWYRAQYFFPDVIISLKLVNPVNSCDFANCRVFFYCFFFDLAKWDFLNPKKKCFLFQTYLRSTEYLVP